MLVTCKNCGAQFSEYEEKCPYCGTMNRKGAYRKFRFQVGDFVTQMFGLKEETERSLSRIVFSALLRSLIIIVLIVALGFALSFLFNVNYFNDKEYDEKAYEEIIWLDTHMDILDEAFAKGDLETISKLYYENYSAFRSWDHYPAYELKKEFQEITKKDKLNSFTLENALYYLYYPEYLTSRRFGLISSADREDYEKDRQTLIGFLSGFGFTEEELQKIYEENADGYGYLSGADLDKYIEGGRHA